MLSPFHNLIASGLAAGRVAMGAAVTYDPQDDPPGEAFVLEQAIASKGRESVDSYGEAVLLTSRQRDFLVGVDELRDGRPGFEPQKGHVIDDGVDVWEVEDRADGECWAFSDAGHSQVRIFTRRGRRD